MLSNAWRRFRRLSIPVELLIAGTLLLAVAVVLEGANVLPFYSSLLALLLSTIGFGYMRRDAVEAFAGGFIIGYGGVFLGPPASFLFQHSGKNHTGVHRRVFFADARVVGGVVFWVFSCPVLGVFCARGGARS